VARLRSEINTEQTKDGEIVGINQRTYPGPGWVQTDIIVVLVSGAIGDYAAYIATGRDPDWCKRHGNKISFKEATCHFPVGLDEDKYRD
jgi:hypothetical protein